MANPPKRKGTAFETEIVRAAREHGLRAERTAPTSPYDVVINMDSDGLAEVVNALATRPDRGQTLVTIPLSVFFDLLDVTGVEAHVECKRYARFALHAIYESKFRGTS